MSHEAAGDHEHPIGRTAELEDVERRLVSNRLLTVTGVGGIGKTTIARALADRIAEAGGHVVVVDLVPHVSGDAMLEAIAIATGATDDTADPLDAIATAIGEAPTTVILDNFEHLLGAASLVEHLLADSAGLRIVVTSRTALDLHDETIVRLAPLALPGSPAEVETAPASALFVRRARERGTLGSIEADDAKAIVELCRRLDGLPLAVELAAAWSTILSPRAIERRLVAGRLDLSRGDPRQASIRAIVESSLELLGSLERSAFGWLGVLVAPFDEAAAQAVTGDDDALVALRGLERIGLVRVQPDAAGEPMFDMLETIRAAAVARLDAAGQLGEARRRHALHYANVATRAADAVRTSSFGSAAAGLILADPNIPAAFDGASSVGDDEQAARIAAALASRAMQTGVFGEALARLRAVVGRPQISVAARCDAINALVSIRGATGSLEDQDGDAERAVDLARQSNDPIRIVRTLVTLGNWTKGDRIGPFTEAATIAAAEGYAWGAATAWSSLSSAEWEAGHIDAAFEALEQARLWSDRAGDRSGIGNVLVQAAEYELNLGRNAEALKHAEEAAAILRTSSTTPFFVTLSLTVLAMARAQGGDHEAACRDLAEAAERVEVGEAASEIGDWLEAAAVVLGARHPVAAARAIGATEASSTGFGPRPSDSLRAALARRIAAAVGDRRLERERAAGAKEPRLVFAELARLVRREGGPDRRGVTGPFGVLSAREQEVLTHLADGASDREIATALGIAAKTASVHVTNVKAKLGVETRVEAALFARERLGVGQGRGPHDVDRPRGGS